MIKPSRQYRDELISIISNIEEKEQKNIDKAALF